MTNKSILTIIIFVLLAAGAILFVSRKNITPADSAISAEEQAYCSTERGCGANSKTDTSDDTSSQKNFATLTSSELASMLENKDFFFVNVHVPYDGEIKDTDAFIPYDKIADNLDKLPKDKNAKIVLYCRSGRMSEIAARELVKLGYSNVSHLAGGMIDWQKNGYEIVKKISILP